jgi:hypothetical protein
MIIPEINQSSKIKVEEQLLATVSVRLPLSGIQLVLIQFLTGLLISANLLNKI